MRMSDEAQFAVIVGVAFTLFLVSLGFAAAAVLS